MMAIANFRLSVGAESDFSIRQCGRMPSNVFESSASISSAAHRAFRRQPGRPRTAAFAPISSTEPQRRPVLVNKSSLKDCIEMRRLSIEERSNYVSATGTYRISSLSGASENIRNMFTRSKSALDYREIELYHRSGIPTHGHRSSLPVKCSMAEKYMTAKTQKTPSRESGIRFKSAGQPTSEKTFVPMAKKLQHAATKMNTVSRLLVNPIQTDVGDMSSTFDKIHVDETFFETMPTMQIGKLVHSDTMQSNCRSFLVVYLFMGDMFQNLALNGSELKSVNSEQQLCSREIKRYKVEIEDPIDGHQSTAGLGKGGSQENIALGHLLQKQLILNDPDRLASDECFKSCDRSITKDVESLNVLVSQFTNTRPPSDQFYYFAYGRDSNTEWFSTQVGRKAEESSWALLYGFRLQSSKHLDRVKNNWPLVEFWPQSAVQGRVYLITRDEATVLDDYALTTLGFQTVMLPVWLMEMNELDDECAAAEYCVPALVCLHPTRCS